VNANSKLVEVPFNRSGSKSRRHERRVSWKREIAFQKTFRKGKGKKEE